MRISANFILSLVAILFAPLVFSQSLPIPKNIEAAYKKATRSTDGLPGPDYWQNHADYQMDIHFNPGSREVSGTVNISYYNNSPDTLNQVWFKLYPNYYEKGAMRDRTINPSDLHDGVSIDSFFFENKLISTAKDRRGSNQLSIQGTNMIMNGQKIYPRSVSRFRISYSYILNEGSHNRTGQVDEGAHFIAYFFPRITVYDDIDGWNRYPYTGSVEFYNDFSNFDVNITVPRNFAVWATGDLQNCNEVFQPRVCALIQQAETNDAIIDIIRKGESMDNITLQKEFTSWNYKASNVIDFAFAVSDHYMWQSSSVMVDPISKRRTRVDAVFDPGHHDYLWVAPDARKTVELMSYRFPKWPFPYSHITVFDGLDQMEYPMMVNDNPVETRFDEVTLTTHEIFHTMFPFYLGTNETKYAWMDEGWATIGEWILSPWIDSSIVDDYGVLPTERHMATEPDLPIITLSTETDRAYFTNSYPEPAMGYLFVKDMLGDSLFLHALHHYIRTWQGKHPMPYDFFNSMNKGSGQNLDWFWKSWFFDNGYADLAIREVKKRSRYNEIHIESVGNKPVPVDLQIIYDDGSTEFIHRDISAWQKGSKKIRLKVPGRKKIKSLQLGSTWVPDTNKSDNFYNAG